MAKTPRLIVLLLFFGLFLGVAIAQAPSFTSVPAYISAGDSYTITWAGGDGSVVTLVLRKGNTQNLVTVDTIAEAVIGYSWVWTVPTTIESGDDYVIQITQGQSSINYSGLFIIEGNVSGGSTVSNKPSSTSSGTGTSTGTQPSPTAQTDSTNVSSPTQPSSSFVSKSSSYDISQSSPQNTGTSIAGLSPNTNSNTVSGAAIAGIVIGALGVVALTVIATLLVIRWRGKSSTEISTMAHSKEDHSSHAKPELAAGSTAFQHEMKSATPIVSVPRHELDGQPHHFEIDSRMVHEKGTGSLSRV